MNNVNETLTLDEDNQVKPGGWPKRYSMMGLMLLAILLCHIDRILMSLAAIEMQSEFSWTDSQKGLMLSAFFVGYLIMQMGGGLLANRFGGRHVFITAVFLWSLFTVLTPPSVYISFTTLVVARFMLGFGEGAAYPSAYNMVHGWVPTHERSRAIGLISSVGALGTIVALLVAGKIIEAYGWQSVFYIFGCFGLVWSIVSYIKIPARGPLDAALSEAENPADKPKVPWKLILTHPAILVLFLVSITGSSVAFMMATWMPSYFVDTFNVSTSDAGFLSIAPWIALFLFTAIGGQYADKKISAGEEVIRVRKRLVTFGYCIAGLSIFSLIVAPSALFAMAAITLLFSGLAIIIPGYSPMPSEVLPKHGDIVYGFMSAAGSIGSASYVALTGVLLEATGSYNTIFTIMIGTCALGAVLFLLFAQATPIDECSGDS